MVTANPVPLNDRSRISSFRQLPACSFSHSGGGEKG